MSDSAIVSIFVLVFVIGPLFVGAFIGFDTTEDHPEKNPD